MPSRRRFRFSAFGAAAASRAEAQTPPSERELRIYAGLHDAAARGDVAEIEQLIAEGEKPNIRTAAAARRCTSPRTCASMRARAR